MIHRRLEKSYTVWNLLNFKNKFCFPNQWQQYGTFNDSFSRLFVSWIWYTNKRISCLESSYPCRVQIYGEAERNSWYFSAPRVLYESTYLQSFWNAWLKVLNYILKKILYFPVPCGSKLLMIQSSQWKSHLQKVHICLGKILPSVSISLRWWMS